MIVVAVPELDQFGARPDRLPPLVRAILARAERRELWSEAWASELVSDQSIPVAPLTRLLDAPDDCAGVWLRADPIQLQPDLNAVWVTPKGHLPLDHPLVNEFQTALAEAGLSFDIPHPKRGYIRLDRTPDCEFVPPDRVIGKSLDDVLPGGAEGVFWQRILNDCQVIAHQHALKNQANGPSGLWFWGAGALPAVGQVQPRVQHLFGTDLIWAALARWLKLSHDAAIPASSKDLADASLVHWLPPPDLAGEAALEALDDWLRPLWLRLRTGRYDLLEIASRTQVWHLNSAASWQVWRRRPEAWR